MSILFRSALFIVLALILYGGYAYVSYSAEFRSNKFFPWFCLIPAVLGSLLWTINIQYMNDPKHIFFYALAIDAAVMVAGLFVAFVWFKVRVNMTALIGILMIIFGGITIKLSSLPKKVKVSEFASLDSD